MYGYSGYSYLLSYGKAVAATTQAVIELLALLFFLAMLAAWLEGFSRIVRRSTDVGLDLAKTCMVTRG